MWFSHNFIINISIDLLFLHFSLIVTLCWREVVWMFCEIFREIWELLENWGMIIIRRWGTFEYRKGLISLVEVGIVICDDYRETIDGFEEVTIIWIHHIILSIILMLWECILFIDKTIHIFLFWVYLCLYIFSILIFSDFITINLIIFWFFPLK